MPALEHQQSAGARRAHQRWHIDRRVVSSKCSLCRLAHPELSENELETLSNIQKATDVVPLPVTVVPAEDTSVPPIMQYTPPKYLSKDRAITLAALGLTVEEVANAFDVTTAQFEEWMVEAFGQTWSQLQNGSHNLLVRKIEEQLILKALRGDLKSIEGLQKFSSVLGPGQVDVVSKDVVNKLPSDPMRMSTEQLQRKRQEYLAVIDAPKRLNVGKHSKTMEVRDASPEEATAFYDTERGTMIGKTLNYDGHTIS